MDATPFDRAAAALLRPGAPLDEVIRVYGTRWRPPYPHREGRVLTADMSDGVVVQITQDAKLGAIRFNWRFTGGHEVLGVRASANEDELRRAFPQLTFKRSSISPFSFESFDLADGLRVDIELGTTFDGAQYLRKIGLSNPSAVYPEKCPVAYAAPTGPPGAPFADVNFKLIVLSKLIDMGEIDLGDPQDFFSHVLGRPFDVFEEGDAFVDEAYAYLARYPLSAELLAKVTSLECDAGAQIYEFVHHYWDGESDAFDVRSVDGFEALVNLKSIRIISLVHLSEADCARLVASGIYVR